MYKKIIKLILALPLLVAGVLVLAPSVSAATLEFAPQTGSYTTGVNFNVEIKVDTKNESTQSTDAVINFDNTYLKVENVTYGSFYPTVLHSEQNGKIYISGVVDNAASEKTGVGTLATVSFKGLKAGVAKLSFECETGRTDDSNVSKNDTNATDLIVCSQLTEASYTLSGETITDPSNDSTSDSTTDSTTDGSGALGSPEYASTIPETGFLDFAALIPKILMGLIFVAIGLVPLLI